MKKKAIIDLGKDNFQNELYIHDFETLKESEIERGGGTEEQKQNKVLFKNVFEQVTQRMLKIIKSNTKNSKDLVETGTTCNNLIPFISGRGTGKTSMMVSTIKFLKDGKWEELYKLDNKKTRNEDVKLQFLKPQFICINKIEADLLEDKESIFETVLIEMYRYFQNMPLKANCDYDEYRSRELMHKFDEVFHNFRLLNQRETGEEYSALQSLHRASLSMNVKEDFANLVRDYVGLIAESENR